MANRVDEGGGGGRKPTRRWLWPLVFAAAVFIVALIALAASERFDIEPKTLLALLVYCGLTYGVGRMAVGYGRSPAEWVFLSILFTPVVVGFFLMFAGYAAEPRRRSRGDSRGAGDDDRCAAAGTTARRERGPLLTRREALTAALHPLRGRDRPRPGTDRE